MLRDVVPERLLSFALALFLPVAATAEGARPAADPAPPAAESPGSGDVPLSGLPALFLKDAVGVLGAPLHWQGYDWLRFGAASAVLAPVAAWTDGPARNAVAKIHSSSLDDVTRVFEPFGAEYSYAILGGFAVFGLVFHDSKARSVAVDGLAASLLASGIITPALKFTIGRARPYQEEGPHHFDPFSGGASLPSGHATQAFAVASVIAGHYRQWWVWTAAYGTASLVAFSRVYHDAHWTADVLAGAFIGTAVGWSVVKLNRGEARREGSTSVSVRPVVGLRAYGLSVSITTP
jgi:membrane-associated phospholipid phosphatase